MTRLETAQAAYVVAFKAMPPEPYGVDDDRIAAVLEQAVAEGKPVDDAFEWVSNLPPGAVV